MDSSFRCWVILLGAMLISLIAWRLARPASAREAARVGWRFLDPVMGTCVDSASGVTIILSGAVIFDLPGVGGQITVEDRLNGELIDSAPPLDERGSGQVRFRDTIQRLESYPLTFSRTAFTHVDGRLVCLCRFGLTAQGPGTFMARLTTTYPAQRPPQPVESAPEPAAPRIR